MLFELLRIEEQMTTLRAFTGFSHLRVAEAFGLRFALDDLVVVRFQTSLGRAYDLKVMIETQAPCTAALRSPR